MSSNDFSTEDSGYGRGRESQHPLPASQAHSHPHSQTDPGGARQVSKTQPKTQGHGHSQSRYSTLPDLRFLNFNKPAPTGTSILDPKSTNSANVQQFQALREAESWFAGTALLLKERLALCEQLRDGLGQTITLLGMIETLKTGFEQGIDGQSQVVAGERPRPADITDQVPVGRMKNLTMDDAQPQLDAIEGATLADSDIAVQPDSIADRSAAPGIQPSTSGNDLEAIEEAIQIWLRDVRVLRAKWIAGGRDTEKRMGLR